jgi:DeoR family ulaG and ulaABCDEF operon transcriptional repressor
MILSLKNRLIFYSTTLVVTTIVMAILTATILIFKQTKEQNYVQLKNAVNSAKSEFLAILPEIEEEYADFSSRKKVNAALAAAFSDNDILVLKDTFTYVGSVRNHFLDFGKTSKVDDFAFYITSKETETSRLIIQYIHDLNGLVIDGTTLFIVDDVEFLNISTVDKLEVFPSELEIESPYSIVRYNNANVLYLVYAVKNYGQKIGYYVLRHYLDVNLDLLDQNFGVHFNLYDLNGRAIDGSVDMKDIDLSIINMNDDTITITDTNSLTYDAILAPLEFEKNIIGYISVSISQKITTNKLLQTSFALAGTGILIVLIGIISALFFVNSISKPITELTLASQAIASGNLQQEIDSARDDELGDLARSFSYMRDSIIEKIHYIEDQNRKLEKRIIRGELTLKEKSNEIQGVLQSIDQGFFTILPDLTIHLTFSDQLKDIFQTEEIARKPVMELLFRNSNLKKEIKNNIQTALTNSLGKGMADFEANKHLFVKEFKKTQTNGRELHLETDWNPLLNEDKVIEKIMVTLRDVSEIRQLQLEADQQKRELDIFEEMGKPSQVHMGEIIESSPGVRKRSEFILQALAEHSFLTTKDLTEMLDVSEATIRRDLTRLSELKLIRRSRGGVKALKKLPPVKVDSKNIALKSIVFAAEKQLIAKRAVEYCSPGDSIIMAGGTTTYTMIKYLVNSSLNITTNSIPIMVDLVKYTSNKVILQGGEVAENSEVILSENNTVKNISASKFFFGAYGIDSNGISQMDPIFVNEQLAYFDDANELILMVDSSKFGRRGPYPLCSLELIDTIITDKGIDESAMKLCEKNGVKVIVAVA